MCVRMWHTSSSLEAKNVSHGFSIDMVIQLRLSCSNTISILIWLRSLNIHLTLRSEYLFFMILSQNASSATWRKALEIVRTGLISAEVLLNVFEFGLFVFIIQKEWSGMFFIFIFILFTGSALPHSSHTLNPRHHIISQYSTHQKITLDYSKSHRITSYHIISYCASPHHTTIHPTLNMPSKTHNTQHHTHHILLERCQEDVTGECRVTSSHLTAPPTCILMAKIFHWY